jgi:hypothetical protein
MYKNSFFKVKPKTPIWWLTKNENLYQNHSPAQPSSKEESHA